jgi:hypothetical protein
MHLATVLLTLASAVSPARAVPSVAITSAPFTLWNTSSSHCERDGSPIDLPDTPARAFVGADGRTAVVAVDSTSRLSWGPSLFDTARDCTIVLNSTLSPDPAVYATDEFLDATWSFGNGTVVALLHDEYPGSKFAGNCTHKGWPACWTVSLSLGVSHDGGRTWGHASPPPSNLVAAVPYKYEDSTTIFGWGDTGGIVQDPRDGYFYATMYNRMTKGLQANGTCVMRTRALLDASSWRGWDGADFTVPFASAYGLAPGAEAAHICTVLDVEMFPPPCVMYGVTWSNYLEAFVSTISCWPIAEPLPEKYTLYWSMSSDMVHWDGMRLLVEPDAPPHTNMITYPALLDAGTPARGDANYATIGQSATLTYVRRTVNFWTYGAQLMGVNVSFAKGVAL